MKIAIPYLFLFLFCSLIYGQEVNISLFANGFINPVDMQNAGDSRLFVVEKRGIIKILNDDGTTNATPFLDIDSIVFTPTDSFDERGLLGLAFHPNYASNGYFYVHYIDNGGDTQISRYTVDSGNADIADPSSAFPIIDYVQPFSNHNGGCLQFGPSDGYLYISSGDGGSGGDPGNRAQNTTLLLGKLLRIDVDNPGGGNNYGIPGDNPFAGSGVDAQEIWAYGLRNPWRFSFDPDNEDIWIGDVGQGDVEEIDRAPITDAGLNYGWRCYEGSVPFNTSGCPDPSELTFPIAEYSSSPGSGNCSVTGGYVYRGTVYSDIQGLYFFADVCSGLIGTVDSAGNLIDHGNFSGTWTSFAVDNLGEMYIVSLNGSIYKIEGGEILSNPNVSETSIALFPNPASENFQIRIENDTLRSLAIIDLSGRRVFSEEGITDPQPSISVAGFARGIYLVQVNTKNGRSFVKKLLIE